MKKYKNSIGETKGVGKLISLKNSKTGIFKCIICKKDYEGNLHSWYYNSKKICTHKNTSHKLYGRYYRMLERCYNKNATIKMLIIINIMELEELRYVRNG